MALIDDIVARVEAIPVAGDGSPALAGRLRGDGFVSAFFTRVVGGPSLTLRGAASVLASDAGEGESLRPGGGAGTT
ncbi:MAG TPA: hypothetical protein VF705_03895 [Longimicrobium sp.]|jgi:hypothetical protein